MLQHRQPKRGIAEEQLLTFPGQEKRKGTAAKEVPQLTKAAAGCCKRVLAAALSGVRAKDVTQLQGGWRCFQTAGIATYSFLRFHPRNYFWN